MKKKMIMLIAAAMMTLSASSAFAALFDAGHLIRVVSDSTTTKEIATDLGLISDLQALTVTTKVGVADAFTAFTTTSFANLSVNYYAAVRTSNKLGDIYIASTPGLTGVDATATGQAGIQSTLTGDVIVTPAGSVAQYYQGLAATGATVVGNNTVGSSTAPGSFGATFGALNTYGSFVGGNFAGGTNMSLASLATAASTANMAVFKFSGNTATTLVGSEVLTLTTNADGTTSVIATAATVTPIPAAAWLLGSGLMGLFGLRRKMNA